MKKSVGGYILKIVGISAIFCIVLLLLASTVVHRWLPPAQRSLRSQLAEAVQILEAKSAKAEHLVAKSRLENLEIVQLRIAFGRGDIAFVTGLLAAHLKPFERFESDEQTVMQIVEVLQIPFAQVLPHLDREIESAPNSYASWLSRGVQRSRLGWEARGGDYATRTPTHRFKKMTEWHQLAVADLLQSLKLSDRPTPSVVELLGIARTYSHPDIAEQLFEAGLRLDPRAASLFNEYSVHLEGKWGHKTITDNSDFVQRASAANVRSPTLDNVARILDYIARGQVAHTRSHSALESARRYSEKHDTYDAWVWRARVEREAKQFADVLISLERAAQHDAASLYVQNELGYALEQLGRIDEARATFEGAAEQGSNYAQYRLIDAHIWSRLGLTRDWDAIRAQCERSAAMLNAAGEFCIGGLYFDGLAGYKLDKALSVSWLRRAAQRHHDIAQHDYGWILVTGKNVPIDREEGVYWLRQAANQNFKMAQDKLDSLGEPLDPPAHTWWKTEQALKRRIVPWLWPLVERLPAY